MAVARDLHTISLSPNGFPSDNAPRGVIPCVILLYAHYSTGGKNCQVFFSVFVDKKERG